MGALYNWVRLQNERESAGEHDATGADISRYDCYFFIADWHALTTDYADTFERPAEYLRRRHGLARSRHRSRAIRDVLCRATFRSMPELHLLLSMITHL